MSSQSNARTAILLSAMMVLVPALGVPHEELLQDSLKSMLVAFFTLTAALVYFWSWRRQDSVVRVHWLLGLPLGLMTYALVSMAWSHAYLGSVEAIRWFLFSVLMFLGMNVFTPSRITGLCWGIHIGAVMACLWAALQFWLDLRWFAQGPNPASTFVNRNFFAEFLVVTLPFSVLLLTRVRDKTSVFLLTFSLGFNITALMMTGTRSALVSMAVLALLLPAALLLCRRKVVSTGWRLGHGVALVVLLLGTVTTLGALDTRNPNLLAEYGPHDTLDRALKRSLSVTQSNEYRSGSIAVRTLMWKATGRMIAAHPLRGVGAGAWEVQVPRFQEPGSQLEIDYYAHNEVLQLLAEYGLPGWLFLLTLCAYLAWAAYRTWAGRHAAGGAETPLRTFTLIAMFVLLLVSNAGFPWHLATTGALFALCLAVLTASDMRLGLGSAPWIRPFNLTQPIGRLAVGLTLVCMVLALIISQQAIECEAKLVRAIKMALTISKSGNPHDPRWDSSKTDVLKLLQEGVAINPHYRKLSPIVADAMAGWGDWKHASWLWESMLVSRPYVVVILTNLARGALQMGDLPKAQQYIERARALQPTASSLASLEVILWSRTGKEGEAMNRATELLAAGVVDHELVQTAYILGLRHHRPQLAITALETGIRLWPAKAVDGWVKLGRIYASNDVKDEERALQSFQQAMRTSPDMYKNAVLAAIPPAYHSRLE